MIDKTTAKLYKFILENSPSRKKLAEEFPKMNIVEEIEYSLENDDVYITVVFGAEMTETMQFGRPASTDLKAQAPAEKIDAEYYVLAPKGRRELAAYRDTKWSNRLTRLLSIAALVTSIAAVGISLWGEIKPKSPLAVEATLITTEPPTQEYQSTVHP